jgi:nucleoside-diphosphate-sugar epimerase
MSRTALVIGATGGIGSETARALLARGWRVTALHRAPPAAQSPISWIRGDAMDAGSVAAAAAGADVIVHAANPPQYRNWRGLALPMLANSIAAARAQRTLLVLPGNLYNYHPDDGPLISEDTPQKPISRKGAVRVEMEAMLRTAAADGVRSLVVRAPDFFGTHAPSSNFTNIVVKPGRPLGRIVYPGNPDTGHAWAYLPDLGEAIAALITIADRLPQFETVNFAGHWLEHGVDMAHAIRRVARNPDLPIRRFPWGLISAMSPFVRLFRELNEMRYLWERPMRLDNGKLVGLLGREPRTPLDEALRTTLAELGCLPGGALAAQIPPPSASSGVSDAGGGLPAASRSERRVGSWVGSGDQPASSPCA